MSALNMTPARIAILRAVADPNIEVYATITVHSWAAADVWMREPGEMKQKVTGKVKPLVSAGLVKVAPVGTRYHQPRPYTLTEAGEKILADLDAKEQ